MPVFIAALLGGIISALGTMVGRVLVSLGIGYVSYQGLDVVLTTFKTYVFSNLAAGVQVAPVIGQFIGVFQIGTVFNILFSAWTARLLIQGVTSGTVKKLIHK